MKKRLLCIMFTVCMVICIMSTAGFAANVENYGFQIGGQDVTSANIGSLSGVTGKVSYDKTKKTLTLDNVTITVPASVTRVPQGINCRKVVTTIELIGKNEIKFEGETYTNPYYLYGINFFPNDLNKASIRGKDKEKDTLKITLPKAEGEVLYIIGITCYNDILVEACTLDILCPEGKSLHGIMTSDGAAARYSITIKNSIINGTLGKDRKGTMQNVHSFASLLDAYGSDITVTDSVINAGAYSKKSLAQSALLEGKNITLTNCELALESKGGSKTEEGSHGSVRPIHVSSGKVRLTNCHGRIESMNGSNGKSYGIDIWDSVPDQCLTIDRCSLEITAGIRAILIEVDGETAKQPVFKNINTITYGADAASAKTEKAGAVTTEYYWRSQYFKSVESATSVTLNKSSLSLINGNSETLTASVATSRAEQGVVWASDNTSVATVDANGKVTAVGAGTANITATAADGSGVSATCAVTVKERTFNVTFMNGGSEYAKQTVENGKTAAVPAEPARDGYAFTGWYRDSVCTQIYDFSAAVTADTTLYAGWMEKCICRSTCYPAGNADCPRCSKNLRRCDFFGSPNNGDAYFAGDVIAARWTMYSYIRPGDVMTVELFDEAGRLIKTWGNFSTLYGGANLYAPDVSPDRYIMRFTLKRAAADGSGMTEVVRREATILLNGAAVIAKDKSVDYLEGMTVDISDMFIFAGNVTANDKISYAVTGGTGVGMLAGNMLSAIKPGTFEITVTVERDAALYPGYSDSDTAVLTVNAFSVIYGLDGGTASGNPEYYSVKTPGFTLNAPARTGYTFTGWSGTGLVGEDNMIVTVPAGSTGDRRYTAHWKPNKYTITFDTDGGSDVASITQDYGTPITAPASPTKVGYTFAGWDKDIPATMPAENITLKAKWKICDHSGNKNALTCANDVTCSVCGATLAAIAHTPEKDDLDCSTPVLCKICGQVAVPGMRHSFGDRWYSDETTHWHFCSNGLCYVKSAISSHDWVDVPALAPTKIEDGYTAHRECTVCGAKCGYEVIPAHEIIRGDFDDNGVVDKKDVIYLLRHTLNSDLYQLNQSGDMNGDGTVDKNDVVYLLRHILLPELYPLK